jgi:cytochrome c-type biogenesis protein CcmE
MRENTGMQVLLAVLVAANLILAPSGILNTPTHFERKSVTVLGIVQQISAQQLPGGWVTQFALCDSRCINVIEFTRPSFLVGQSVTVTGIFHTIFSRGIIQARNCVVVGE